MRLERPAPDLWPGMAAALRRGWPPNNMRRQSAREALAQAEADLPAFLASLDVRHPTGMVVVLPDGSRPDMLPWFQRWIWDEGFCGVLALRWTPGSDELPPHVLGHVGYSVVPWRRRRGYATFAMKAMLPIAREIGIRDLQVTCDLDNVASAKVIEKAGGVHMEVFVSPGHGPETRRRFVIRL